MFRIYKELLQLNRKTSQVINGTRRWIDISPKIIPNVTSPEGDAHETQWNRSPVHEDDSHRHHVESNKCGQGWRNWNPCWLLSCKVATMENGLVAPQEAKHRLTIGPSNPALTVYLRALEAGTEHVLARGCSHSIVHRGPEGDLQNGLLPMDGGAGVVCARQWVSLSLQKSEVLICLETSCPET